MSDLINQPLSTALPQIRLGVLSDEFFDARLGGYGGFGWATRMLAEFFCRHPEFGIELVFLTNRLRGESGAREKMIHETRLILRGNNRAEDFLNLRRERLDLLLMIDYNLGYRFHCVALPRTPVILWVRDPRTPQDWAEIGTLKIPGQESISPQGITPHDGASVATLARFSRWFRRPFLFGSPHPGFAGKMRGAFHIQPELYFLPNVIPLTQNPPRKSLRPSAAFLGRLDPIKRPWVAVEIARRMPSVEFYFLGARHFDGAGAWTPDGLPANVHLLGQMDAAEKSRVLASVWVLVNTSIHEGLAVSFLEALASETPIVSSVDPGGIVERYGVYVGKWLGTGMDSVPAFVTAFEELLRDPARRVRLGKEGYAWVRETHNETRFGESFMALCAHAGVGRG